MTTEADRLLEKGIEALGHGHNHLAMSCLEQAMSYGRTARISSYLAYCMALNGRQFDDAIAMGREALETEPNSPVYCHNLGRILLLAGSREEAIEIFRQGLSNSRDAALIAQLEELGTRKPPVFRQFPRNHPINRFFGLLLNRLGLRS